MPLGHGALEEMLDPASLTRVCDPVLQAGTRQLDPNYPAWTCCLGQKEAGGRVLEGSDTLTLSVAWLLALATQESTLVIGSREEPRGPPTRPGRTDPGALRRPPPVQGARQEPQLGLCGVGGLPSDSAWNSGAQRREPERGDAKRSGRGWRREWRPARQTTRARLPPPWVRGPVRGSPKAPLRNPPQLCRWLGPPPRWDWMRGNGVGAGGGPQKPRFPARAESSPQCRRGWRASSRTSAKTRRAGGRHGGGGNCHGGPRGCRASQDV